MSILNRGPKTFHCILIGAVFISGILISLFAFEEKKQYLFPEDPLRGSKLFVSKGCIKCHAIWGIGDALGPDLARMSKEQNFLHLTGLLWSHSPKMIEIMQERGVSRPIFTPQEMGDLMGYIYYFNYFDKPGNFIEGERLFDEKGCARCHSVGENEGKNKMPLDDYGKYISPSFLVTGLWNHSSEILSEMKKIGLKQPEFIGQELTHLLAYIQGAAENPDGEIVYAEPGSPKRGEDIFKQKKCNVCHAVWGEGGKYASDLGSKKLQQTLTVISGKIWSHSSQMRQEMRRIGLAFPVFLPEEMADLISYLYFIQFYHEEGDPREGKRLFREKVCILCHALEGEGENIGPDLSESEAQLSQIYLATAMWNHANVMKNMLAEKDSAWPRFSGNEMQDLVSYIQDVSMRSKAEKKKK
jgi:cytochrome c2